MPDFNVEDRSELNKETFPYEIKINNVNDSIFLNMIKNMGIKNVLNDELI